MAAVPNPENFKQASQSHCVFSGSWQAKELWVFIFMSICSYYVIKIQLMTNNVKSIK